jgi:hypothetical protein
MVMLPGEAKVGKGNWPNLTKLNPGGRYRRPDFGGKVAFYSKNNYNRISLLSIPTNSMEDVSCLSTDHVFK